MWVKHSFLDDLYKETTDNQTRIYGTAWKTKVKERFRKCLGDFSSSEPLNARLLDRVTMDGYVRYSAEITTLPKLTMQFYLLVPNHVKPMPAVLALHGHGFGNKAAVGLNPDGTVREGPDGYHKDFAITLVKKGIVVVVPELIGFGERRYSLDTTENERDNSCYSLASQLLLMGKTLAGLRVFECQRLIDYIETLDFIDSTRVGCMGISGGGLVAAFLSCLDDRIKTTVISGYTNTFKESIIGRRHCLDNYIPGVLEFAEMPELIALNVPKPLFIEAGKNDHLFHINGVKKAVSTIEHIYSVFGADDRVQTHYFDGGHEICGDQSIEWLVKKLEN